MGLHQRAERRSRRSVVTAIATTQRSACTIDNSHQERSNARSPNVHHNPLEIPFRLGMSSLKYQKSTGTTTPGLPLHSRACSSAGCLVYICRNVTGERRVEGRWWRGGGVIVTQLKAADTGAQQLWGSCWQQRSQIQVIGGRAPTGPTGPTGRKSY